MVRLNLFLIALAVATSCTSGPQPGDDRQYLTELSADRATKDQFMAEDRESPIPANRRASLLPLRYFAPDPLLAVPASLRLQDDRPVFEMPTSTGTIRRMQLVGVLEFTLAGQATTLGAFVEEGTREISTLFVPFADQTTGHETYPAGRYLDLHPTATGYYTIDFNRAYNPYCAYNSTYECPYPPPSNRLKVPVRAGERAPGV
ncbi:MAG: DUF1684 domain-containing protein [Vicinamibacterales bacterium]